MKIHKLMKTYTFNRESNNFSDILQDPVLKKAIRTKLFFKNHLIIGLKHDIKDSIISYLMIKYGEDIVSLIEKDYTPKPKVDYIPIRN